MPDDPAQCGPYLIHFSRKGKRIPAILHGKVRDALLGQQEQWLDSLKQFCQSSIRAGGLRDGIDCDQFAFDLYSLLLGFHLQRFLKYTEIPAYEI